MSKTYSVIIIVLVLAWVIQYLLSFWQLRRFYKRIHELRRYGSVWIGKEGSAWKGRQYAVLVVNKEKVITKVEQFSGWTVLATLKPVSGLEGRPICDLLDDSIELPVSRKMRLALRNAVKYIQETEERAAAKKKADLEASAMPESLEKPVV
jgi:DNA-binding transcriptional regulator of glucitol operon